MAATWFFKSRGPNAEDDYTWISLGSEPVTVAHEILQQGYNGRRCFDLIDDESPNLLLFESPDGQLVLLVSRLIPPDRPADNRNRTIRVSLLGAARLDDEAGCRALIGVAVLALRDELAPAIPIRFGTGQAGAGFAVDPAWPEVSEAAGQALADPARQFPQLSSSKSWLRPDTEDQRRKVADELSAGYLRLGLESLAGRIIVLRTSRLDADLISRLRGWRSLSSVIETPHVRDNPAPAGGSADRGLADLVDNVKNLIQDHLPFSIIVILVLVVGGPAAGLALTGTGGGTVAGDHHHQTTSPKPTPSAPPPVTPAAVYAWGDSSHGDLGQGSAASASTGIPAGVSLAAKITAGDAGSALAAGRDYSLAVTSTGRVLAWGGNSSGQLGNDTDASTATPVYVSLPARTKIIGVSAGCLASVAVSSTGQVWAWGDNTHDQLGVSAQAEPSSSHPVPVRLPPGIRAIAVSAGCSDTVLLTSGHHVLAWGDNDVGELGDDQSSASPAPVKVKLPSSIKIAAVSAGCTSDLALAVNGQVYAWGDGSRGQLGNGKIIRRSLRPVKVQIPVTGGTGHVTAISAGCDHDLALTSAGAVFAWGSGASGQLGLAGSTASRAAPEMVSFRPGTAVVAISAADDYSLALTSDGKVLAWGSNSENQLGTGKGKPGGATPTEVGLKDSVAAIGAGPDARHTLAVPGPPPA